MSRLDDISAENLRDKEDFFRKQKEEAARVARESECKVPVNRSTSQHNEQPDFAGDIFTTYGGQSRGDAKVQSAQSLDSSLRDKIMGNINRKRHVATMTVEQCNELENDLNDETVKRVLRVLSIG